MPLITPNAVSWPITTKTIFREEVEFHKHGDDDFLVIEQYNEDEDVWFTWDEKLRLTLYRLDDDSTEETP